jgi:hypothetical protein
MKNVKVNVSVPMGSRLHEEIGAAADEAGVPMNTVICDAVAKALGKPELAMIPRQRVGRKRGVWSPKQRRRERVPA